MQLAQKHIYKHGKHIYRAYIYVFQAPYMHICPAYMHIWPDMPLRSVRAAHIYIYRARPRNTTHKPLALQEAAVSMA